MKKVLFLLALLLFGLIPVFVFYYWPDNADEFDQVDPDLLFSPLHLLRFRLVLPAMAFCLFCSLLASFGVSLLQYTSPRRGRLFAGIALTIFNFVFLFGCYFYGMAQPLIWYSGLMMLPFLYGTAMIVFLICFVNVTLLVLSRRGREKL